MVSKDKCKAKYIINPRFFRVATFCFDNSFVYSWYSPSELQDLYGQVFHQSSRSFQICLQLVDCFSPCQLVKVGDNGDQVI